jgi:hypothetical protein
MRFKVEYMDCYYRHHHVTVSTPNSQHFNVNQYSLQQRLRARDKRICKEVLEWRKE